MEGGNTMKYLEQYEEYLIRNGKSEKTTKDYLFNTTKFLNWLEETSGEEFGGNVTLLDVNTYTSYLSTVQKSALSTINAKLSAIQSFANFLHYEYGMTPIKVQKKKGNTDPKVEVLSKQELFRYLKQVETSSLLNQTIIYMVLNTGIREEELCNLELDDIINLDQHKNTYIIVRNGKGGKYREIPINGDFKKLLKEYLEHRPTTDSKKVFIGQRGTLSPNGVYRLVQRLGDTIGIRVYPHMLRHQFLTQASKNCKTAQDIKDLSVIAGHSSIDTTMRYYISGSKENQERISQVDFFAD